MKQVKNPPPDRQLRIEYRLASEHIENMRTEMRNLKLDKLDRSMEMLIRKIDGIYEQCMETIIRKEIKK